MVRNVSCQPLELPCPRPAAVHCGEDSAMSPDRPSHPAVGRINEGDRVRTVRREIWYPHGRAPRASSVRCPGYLNGAQHTTGGTEPQDVRCPTVHHTERTNV